MIFVEKKHACIYYVHIQAYLRASMKTEANNIAEHLSVKIEPVENFPQYGMYDKLTFSWLLITLCRAFSLSSLVTAVSLLYT